MCDASATEHMTGSGPPSVSIIIPHLNQIEGLARCLVSVGNQDYPRERVEIIVVDNGSTLSLTALQAAWPEVRFLREPTPGPGAARNLGVANAGGDILLFIDADCRAGAGWITAAVRVLLRRPGRGIVGGDVRIDFRHPARRSALEAYEAVFAYQQKMYIQRKHFSGTGNLGMWAPVHAAVGPFVGIAFAEDVEWGKRAHDKGFAIDYVPDMIIYHPARRTFAELQSKWRRHVAHEWNDHVAHGGSPARWQVQRGKVLASVPVHALKLLLSPRIGGPFNRLKGIGVLARVRGFRVAEMARLAAGAGDKGATGWNRGA